MKQLLIKAIKDYEISNKKLQNQQESLRNLAYYDQVVQIYNKQFLTNELIKENIVQESDYLIMVLIDISQLNVINAFYGMQQGELFFKNVVNVLIRHLPKDAIIGRMSSDELILIFPEGKLEDIKAYKKECLASLKSLRDIAAIAGHRGYYISYNIWDPKHKDFGKSYTECQTAILYAKENNIFDMVAFEPNMSQIFMRASQLLGQIEDAIHQDEFQIWFQGKYSTLNQTFIGYEALARWITKENEFISPGEFIPLINHSMHLNEFSKYILQKSVQEFEDLISQDDKVTTLSLNITPLFFLHNDFESYIIEIIHQSRIEKNQIILEITEDVLIDDYQLISDKVDRLVSKGFKVSLDDFGSGYSSLNHINSINISEIKIDRSIIQHIKTNEKSRSLVELVNQMANKLNLQVIAEGVETIEEVELLETIGIHLIQGYYYSKPQSVEKMKNAKK